MQLCMQTIGFTREKYAEDELTLPVLRCACFGAIPVLIHYI